MLLASADDELLEHTSLFCFPLCWSSSFCVAWDPLQIEVVNEVKLLHLCKILYLRWIKFSVYFSGSDCSLHYEAQVSFYSTKIELKKKNHIKHLTIKINHIIHHSVSESLLHYSWMLNRLLWRKNVLWELEKKKIACH